MQEGVVSGRTLLGMENLVEWMLVNCCSSVCSDYTSSSFPYAIVVIAARSWNKSCTVSGSTFLPYEIWFLISSLTDINKSEYSGPFPTFSFQSPILVVKGVYCSQLSCKAKIVSVLNVVSYNKQPPNFHKYDNCLMVDKKKLSWNEA